MWVEVQVLSFNLHYPKIDWAWKSNSGFWEPENEDSLSVRMKGHFSESDSRVDSERRCPSHRCHMKNALKSFHARHLSSLTWLVVPKVWLLALGCLYSFVLRFFAYPEFFVSFKSHLRRRNFWSIWNRIQVIREQPCFFPSSAVCHTPADISKRSVCIRARWRVSCIFSCCLGEKSDEPKCMFIFRQRKRRTEKKQARCDRISESSVMWKVKRSEHEKTEKILLFSWWLLCGELLYIEDLHTQAWSDDAVFYTMAFRWHPCITVLFPKWVRYVFKSHLLWATRCQRFTNNFSYLKSREEIF